QTALTSGMVPWDGSVNLVPWVAGNTEPSGGADPSFTAQSPRVVTPPCYDTNPPQITVVNPGNLVNFNDVPAGETAMRAAVFDCVVCKETINFSISAGPTGPYGVLIGNAPVTPKAGHQTARIWLSFTGTTAGTTAPNGSVTIHCAETNQDFVFTLHGNTINRPSVAVELVLDQSGSMNLPAGTTAGVRRMDVLKSAAGVFKDIIQGGNAAGLVRFDTQAYGPSDPTFPGLAITNIASDNASDSGRQALKTAIDGLDTNINGSTSIGAGVQLGRNQLNPVSGFDKKAMIVFTDGLENTPPMIADVMGSIGSDTFAIGLGSATDVSVAALTALCNNHNGFVLLTDTLTPNTSDFFLVKKYFLQILAGVQNNQVVVDPVGKVLPGQVISVPFHLSDADIQATTILLTDIPALRMRLRTPAGDMMDPVVATTVGAQYTVGQNLVFYRYLLPVALGAGAQSGTWWAVLEMDPAIVKRCKEDQRYGIAATAAVVEQPTVCEGVRYSVQVHAWSNLRMKARVLQTSFAPGASLTIRAVLTEYNTPVDHRATVSATVTRPDETEFHLPLKEIEPGVFEAHTVAAIPGVYKFLVHASGKTLRGISFTREQYLTAAAFYGGDNPLPTSAGDGSAKLLCCLLNRLLHDPGFIRYLEERKIDSKSLLQCLEECCAARETYEPGQGTTIATSDPAPSIANLSRMIASDEKLRSALADLVGSSINPR
ncbi:MAG TPA: VWA domain-containing protein, partial [Candidatus Binataceae bacterium]|nr:VWA domain-containing protein [Candidatus Binataceae bacterium]